MSEEMIRKAMQNRLPEPPEGFDGRSDQRLVRRTAEEGRKVKRTPRVILVFALILVLGSATALAAFNEDVNQILYMIWPQAAQSLKPVSLACEDRGIRMEVVSASLNGSESLVTLTMQDLEGDRIDETMDLFDSAILQLPYDGSGTCVQTGYDPETKTASFAVYMDFSIDGRPAGGDKVTFSVTQFLSHKREQTIDLTSLLPGEIGEAASMPVPEIRGWSGSPQEPGTPVSEEEHRALTEQARSLRVLDPAAGPEIPVTEGVTLTGIGIVDGMLHIQIRYDDIHHTDNHGFVTLSDTDGNSYDETQLSVSNVSWFNENRDSFQEYIFDRYPADLSRLVVTGWFVTAAPAVEGNWHVTFPLSLIRNE